MKFKMDGREFKITATKRMVYRTGEFLFLRRKDAMKYWWKLRKQGWNPRKPLQVLARVTPDGRIFPTLKAAIPAVIERKKAIFGKRGTKMSEIMKDNKDIFFNYFRKAA